MIKFNGTKKVGFQSYMIFINEKESIVEVPVDDKICALFMLYFDRLTPPSNPVETTAWSE
jgi:hypothetical protein